MGHGRTERRWVAGRCGGGELRIAPLALRPGEHCCLALFPFWLDKSDGHCLLGCDTGPGEHGRAHVQYGSGCTTAVQVRTRLPRGR